VFKVAALDSERGD